VRIIRLDTADSERMLACHEVYLAAHRADEPDGNWLGPSAFSGWMTVGWQRQPQQAWLATDDAGTVASWYVLRLPDQENQHLAGLALTVHPAWRRRGIGGEMLRHATERAAQDNRSELGGSAADGLAGEFFARQAGASPGLRDVCRVQRLTALPPLSQARADCERAAAAYSTVSWTGPVPEGYLDGVAALFDAFADQPHREGFQPPRWNAQRVRDDINEMRLRLPQRTYAIAALHDVTGEMAAMSEVFTDPEVPGWATQGATVVTRQHRGHRLGLLVKLAMLDLLSEAEPSLQRIQTWNADANSHMIAVNQTLGYTVTGPPHTRWTLPLG
jgi:GNAT superfamily N-acetyltransferase